MAFSRRIALAFYDWPGYAGGPNIMARRLLPELKQRGHAVCGHVLSRGDASPAADWLENEGVTVCRGSLRWGTRRMVRWILETLQEFDPDIFIPFISAPAAYAARWVREAGRPTIVSHVSDDAFNWGMADEFAVRDHPWRASGLHCISEALADQVQARCPAATVATIPNWGEATKHVATQSGPIRVVYSGRLNQPQKRIRELVAAVCRLVKSGLIHDATLIGTGEEERWIRKTVAREGLESRVRLLGFVPQHQLAPILAEHHVLLLLSDFEGQPGAVIDGMLAGLVPVVLRCPGGLDELVADRQTGLVVTDREESFDTALRWLESEPSERRKLAEQARAFANQNHSVAAAVDKWEAFMERLLAAAGPRRPIDIPRVVKLPPVHPALRNDDIRWHSWRHHVGRVASSLRSR